MNNQFSVHANILCRASETLRTFISQPAQGDFAGKKLTLHLPDDVSNKVGIEFFKGIYQKIVAPNVKDFDCSELQSFFQLSDMHFLNSLKNLVKEELKKRCKEKIKKFYPEAGSCSFEAYNKIPESESKILSKILQWLLN